MYRISIAALLLSAAPLSAMTLSSTDITDGGPIAQAQIYPRCGGQNISPQLSWSGAPKGTESFVLTMVDTDVKPSGWSHWILIGIPPRTSSLGSGAGTIIKTTTGVPPASTPPSVRGLASLPDGTLGVISNFGDPFYDGPCPPAGSGTHHYRLTIWAMPAPMFMLDPDEKAADVEFALGRAALDHAAITGTVAAPEAKAQ